MCSDLTHKRQQNPIAKIMRSRASTLLTKLNEAKDVEHSTSSGDVREDAIKEYLRGFIPTDFAICSGQVADALHKKASPQLDAIVYQPGAVPPILLTGDKALVPFEAFGFAIEIKSDLKVRAKTAVRKTTRKKGGHDDEDHFEQIKKQAAALNDMHNSAFFGKNNAHFRYRVPYLTVFAHSTGNSLETIMKRMEEIPNLVAVFIVEKGCILQQPGAKPILADECKPENGMNDEDRIVFASATIHNLCLDLSVQQINLDPKMTAFVASIMGVPPGIQIPTVMLQRAFKASYIPYLYKSDENN